MKACRNIFSGIPAIVAMALIAVILFSCQREKPPFKIGFVGGLTGRYSDLGVSGRNGAMLAVEEINENGGIRGRKILLIAKDDRQDEQRPSGWMGSLSPKGLRRLWDT